MMNGKRCMTELRKRWKGFLSIIFALVAWYCWSQRHAYLMGYWEEMQLFQTTTAYFTGRLSVAGGFAWWLSELLVQFFRMPWVGGAIAAAVLVGIQWTTWLLARRQGATDSWYALSFVPSLLMWGYMPTEGVNFSLPLALALTLALCLIVKPTGQQAGWRNVCLWMAVVPAAYWLLGTVVYLFALYVATNSICRTHPRWKGVVAGAAVLVWTLVVVWGSSFVLHYPLQFILTGIPYYIFPLTIPWPQMHLMWIAALMPFAIGLLPHKPMPRLVAGGLTILVAVAGVAAIGKRFERKELMMVRYDYYVAEEQWGKILETAFNDIHPTTMSVACTDLALYETGRLTANLYGYPQNGPEGLFLSMEPYLLASVTIGEILFRMGLPNEAMRYFYDAQESISNYNMSGRMTKRLAEIELINGQYDAAEKYLHLLQRTFFYRRWAEERLEMLGNEDAINAHPVYGYLRRCRTTDDSLFQPTFLMDKMEELYRHYPENKMVIDYANAVIMLEKQKKGKR